MATGSVTSKQDPAKAAAPKGAAKPSAAPGTVAPEAATPKGKKGKGKGAKGNRPVYPGLINAEDGKASKKLTDLPTDFDSKTMRPLKRANFDSDALFMRWQAKIFRDKAERFERQAERLSKLGSRADQSKLKRLAAMQERMAELRKELEGEDMDVDAMLAELTGE